MNYRNPILVLALAGLLISCTTAPREISPQTLLDSYDQYVADYKVELSSIELKAQQRLSSEYLNEEYQSYDVLVLSGGGAHGAFGAGFLKGWGSVSDEEFSRPDFDSVSGVSTGALIAPFAFIGDEASYEKLVEIYSNPDENLISQRALLSFLFRRHSYYDATLLQQQIRENITSNIVRDIASSSAEKKTLLVGATNLDYGMMRVWDLGEVAQQQSTSTAIEEISTKLIASSAIPAAFPSVEIGNYLYVDGGASMQVISGIQSRDWLYADTLDADFLIPNKPIRIRIWVLINNKLSIEPEVTSSDFTAVVARSLASLLNSSMVQTLQDIETFTQMINMRPEFDAKMYYVSIPNDYEILQTKNLFDQQKMRNLVDLGEQMGADINSWNATVRSLGEHADETTIQPD